MIFISGVHGVGKGYFCNLVNKELGIESYTASDLISKGKDIDFDSNKLVSDIVLFFTNLPKLHQIE